MKKALYLVLILIIIGLSYLKWQARQNPLPTESIPSPTPVVNDNVTGRNAQLITPYFSLDYPSVASSSPVSEAPDSLTWTVRYIGATQIESSRTQSELSDGYIVTISRFPEVVGDDPSLTQAESDREGTVNQCGDSSVTKIREEQIAGKSAHAFTGGCIAEATSYYFMDEEVLYRVTTIAVAAPEVIFDYNQAISKILSTFKLL
jgi:hypothetical protein